MSVELTPPELGFKRMPPTRAALESLVVTMLQGPSPRKSHRACACAILTAILSHSRYVTSRAAPNCSTIPV